MKAAKFWVALVAAVASGVLTVVAPDSQAGKVAAIVVALAGAAGVYLVPNAGPTSTNSTST